MYKGKCNKELLDLFKIAQNVHTALLKLVEACYINEENHEDLGELTDFLNEVIDIGEILSDLNIKCMVENWKGYTAITRKFADFLMKFMQTNINNILLYFEKIISRNLLQFKESINVNFNEKNATQHIKVTNFLIKVILKLAETFWSLISYGFEAVLKISSLIYSFSVPNQCKELYYKTVLQIYEPFMNKLCNEEAFIKFVENMPQSEENCCESLYILNTVFNHFKTADTKISLSKILMKLFDTLQLAGAELTFNLNGLNDCLYENLLVNVATALLLMDSDRATKLIIILNMFHDHMWCSMFATDLWCLILSNLTPNMILQTLNKLIEFQIRSVFGLFTYRTEKMKLNNMLQRMYDMLPKELKKQLMLKYPVTDNVSLWNILGYEDVRDLEKTYLKSITPLILNVQHMHPNTSFEDFFAAFDYLESAIILTPTNDSFNLICELWNFNKQSDEILSNNIFKFFIWRMCEVTRKIKCFEMTKLISVLENMLSLHAEPSFQIPFLSLLSDICYSCNEYFGAEQYKILRLISTIIHQILLESSIPIVRLKALDFVKQLDNSELYSNTVKIIMQNAKDYQEEISRYIHGSHESDIDSEYPYEIDTYEFTHECVKWNRKQFFTKKDVLRMNVANEENEKVRLRITENSGEFPPAKKSKIEEETCDVGEAISTIKCEVKNLMNILKTEKMTPKNSSQLKNVISQLQSLL
ncbi:uncharacterized protein LOC109608482 isoform X2 [Aethina tumida]|nr:uncharacterized protein LOC109608482 isoform X2 [Aethina tumida]